MQNRYSWLYGQQCFVPIFNNLWIKVFFTKQPIKIKKRPLGESRFFMYDNLIF